MHQLSVIQENGDLLTLLTLFVRRGRFPSPSSTLKPTRNANLATLLPNLDCFHHVLHSLDSLRKSSSLLSSLNSLPDILDSHLTVAVAGLEATATGLRLIIRITKTLM